MIDPSAPVVDIPDNTQKAINEAFGVLAEKLSSLGVRSSDDDDEPHAKPGSTFLDPNALMDSYGMGYRESPSPLTTETLRAASERNVIVASAISLRIGQVASFSRPQPNKYSVGHEIRLRGRSRRRPVPEERRRIDYIERFLSQTGMSYNVERDSFDTFLRKTVRDRFTYDATAFEKTRTRGGDLYAFFAVDGSTIRIADPKDKKGAPPEVNELRSQIRHVQVIEGRKEKEYTSDELAYLVANPRSSVRVHRYGFSEIEMLMTTITSHLWAEQFNSRIFSQGSTVRGLLNIKGKIPIVQLELMRKQWAAQLAGVNNAWKTPLINSDGVDFIPLQMTNQEMGFQAWIEYLIRCTAAIFNMDPAEIGFDLRGGIGQQPAFMSSNEAQQKVSKDKGLRPLLRFLEEGINRHIIWLIDDRFEFSFVGLDAKTEEQAAQLRIQQGQAYMTMNEVRALEDLPPVKHGDFVMNPVFAGFVQMAQAEKMQKQAQAQAQAQAQMAGQPQAQEVLPPATEEDQAFLQKPGEEERVGAGRLVEFAGQSDEDDVSGGVGPPPQSRSRLKRDDWSSTVHSAVKSPDLKKSVKEKDDDFIIVDLD